MKELTMEEMASIEGGWSWGCAGAIAGGVLLIAGLSVTPVGAWAVGVYVTTAIAGPTLAGTAIGAACAS